MALPMADPETERDDDDPRKRRGPGGTQDPTFYEGLTPVLGEQVTLKEPAGELTFPQASAAPPPDLGPAPTMPTPPDFPEFPTFEFGPPPEFQFEPGTPPAPPDINAPQLPEAPWWAKAMAVADPVIRAGFKGYNLAGTGGRGGPRAESPEALFPQGSPGGLGGPSVSSPEALFPQAGDMTEGAFGPATQGQPVGLGAYLGPALSALQVGGGIYGLAGGEPGTPGYGAGLLNTAGGAAGLAGSSAGASALGLSSGLAGSLSALGGAAGLASLPLILGPVIESMTRQDKARWPEGFQYVPGTGDSRGIGGSAVDPNSGAVLDYQGGGKYAWNPRTLERRRATPEEMRAWGIAPAGELAQDPAYAGVARQIRDDAVRGALGGGLPAATTAQPATAPVTASAVQRPDLAARSYLEEWRQPFIDKLKAQNPTASEAELWRLYTLTPEYRYEVESLWPSLLPTQTPGGGGGGVQGGF